MEIQIISKHICRGERVKSNRQWSGWQMHPLLMTEYCKYHKKRAWIARSGFNNFTDGALRPG